MEQAYSLHSTPRISIPFRAATLLRNGSVALGVTGLLLFGMSQLIATDFEAPPVDDLPKIADIIMPEVAPTVEKSVPPPKPQELPPAPPVTQVERTIEPGEIPTTFHPPTVDDPTLDPALTNSDPLPVFKPAPRYPRRALARGIEGYVVVEFTITSNGSVRDARVVGGFDSNNQPTSVFDREAINAVERFKYRPPVADGRPVERHGVRNRIVFKMAD